MLVGKPALTHYACSSSSHSPSPSCWDRVPSLCSFLHRLSPGRGGQTRAQSLDAEMHSRPVNHRPLAPEVKVYSREGTLLRRKKKKALFIYYFLRPCPKDASQQQQPLFSELLQSVSQHLPLLKISPDSVPVLLIGIFSPCCGSGQQPKSMMPSYMLPHGIFSHEHLHYKFHQVPALLCVVLEHLSLT